LQFTAELAATVDRARDAGELAALLYLDLDRFKPVNDEFGHATGDALLVAVAERLEHCTRPGDVVARLGGDEFAVLVAAPDAEAIAGIQRRILAGFASPFEIGGHRLSLGVSVGRAVYPVDAADADGLLREADVGMFAHKRDKRAQLSAAR
jgi:diguanylate cyclase (GGDEF)-like protein